MQKISQLLKPRGIFFVSFIEGEDEGFEDPTKTGKLRYFARWSDNELNDLFLPYFNSLKAIRYTMRKWIVPSCLECMP